MKILFVSNYFNHHQKPVSDAIYQRVCHNYTFLETQEMERTRKILGWGEKNIPRYVCRVWDADNELHDDIAVQRAVITQADVVITGSASERLIRNRIKSGKIVFRYAERPLKNGNSLLRYIPRWIKWHIQNPVNKPVYMLCASAYTAEDYAKFGLFRNKTYKWGYFPETKHYDVESLWQKKGTTDILWCGRFLDWKHPDDALKVAKRLKEEGYCFRLSFVGTGEMESQLHRMVADSDLDDCVCFLGAKDPQKVRDNMEKAGIYLFTSDRKEGWGAVLNEAMNSGCAVVASRDAGATPYLVSDNENGLIYQSGNVEALYQKVKYLLDHSGEQKRLGLSAYHTIVDMWNAENAAARLINLAEYILAGEESPQIYTDGPCSSAEIINESEFA